MNKILYIAPFRDFSGYATAARGYLKALDMAGADIVARAIKYDMADPGTQHVPSELERRLLAKPLDKFNIVVQHVTPNEMRPFSNCKNIAVCAWETDKIPKYWADNLNRFDKIITFCQTTKKAFEGNGVTRPVFVVPHCFDMATYANLDSVEKLKVGDDTLLKDRHIFYNISQLSQKKGLDALIKAYFTEFCHDEDVLLVMKTYIGMSARQNEREKVVGFINQIKGALKLPRYPQVVIITQTMTEHQIKRLHATGHTYVCSSRGEGWNIPAFEALAYGNKLVTTDWGGMSEFIKPKEYKELFKGYLPGVFPVMGSLEPVFGQAHPDPELYTAEEKWFEPSVTSMGKAMREAKNAGLCKKVNLDHFDHAIVGKQMLGVIQS